MKRISILGSGRVGTALATRLAQSSYQVTVGTRNGETALPGWRGPAVEFCNHVDAIRVSPIVVNATPGDTSLERFTALREELSGKILVDVSNATVRDAGSMPGDLLYPNSSLAEHLQSALVDTHVVKTLNTMMFTVMVSPSSLAQHPTAFISGNDPQAKEAVVTVLQNIGWPVEWIMDLGDVTSARGTEAMFSMVPLALRKLGLVPFALTLTL